MGFGNLRKALGRVLDASKFGYSGLGFYGVVILTIPILVTVRKFRSYKNHKILLIEAQCIQSRLFDRS